MRRSTKDPKKKQTVFNFGAPEPWACCSDDVYIGEYSDYASFSDLVAGQTVTFGDAEFEVIDVVKKYGDENDW